MDLIFLECNFILIIFIDFDIFERGKSATMINYPESIENLIGEFGKLPGIGYKTAVRLTMHMLDISLKDAELFSNAIIDIKKNIKQCDICGNYTQNNLCFICLDKTRDTTSICVVEQAKDIYAFEKTGSYRGLYHVLHGKISPSKGIGPDKIKINELLNRINSETREIILATNPNIEGEATSLYISKLLSDYNLNISKIAHGIPIGSDLEYIDDLTLMKALDGRFKIK